MDDMPQTRTYLCCADGGDKYCLVSRGGGLMLWLFVVTAGDEADETSTPVKEANGKSAPKENGKEAKYMTQTRIMLNTEMPRY